MMSVSPQRRLEIMDSLRRGTVPRNSLDAFAVGLERPFESFEAHRECVQAVSWHGSAPQGIHDLQAALGADGHHGLLHQIELLEEEVTVEFNCVGGVIAAQDR